MLIHFLLKGLVVFFLVNCTDSVLLNESEAINVGCPEWKYHSRLENKNETVQSVSLNAIMSTLFRPRAHNSISQRVKAHGRDFYDCLSWSVQRFLKMTSWFPGKKIKATNLGCAAHYRTEHLVVPASQTWGPSAVSCFFWVSTGWPRVSINNQCYLQPYFTISTSRCGNSVWCSYGWAHNSTSP